MRDEHHGLPVLLPDAQKLPLQEAPGERVERAERLVHEDDRGLRGERARDRHPLLHPAGKLVDAALGEVLESYHPQVDRKSTRLNSSHLVISYAVFCLKKKKNMCTIEP